MRKEIIICGVWLMLSLYIAVESYRLGLTTANRPGPGFFPFGATAAMGAIAVSRLFKAFQRTSAESTSESAADSDTGLVLGVLAGMIAYVLLLDLLGFLFCTFLLVAFYLKIIAQRRWPVSLSFALAVTLVAHLFFDVLLTAQLPRGLLNWLM